MTRSNDDSQSLQDRFAPQHGCFGCGPANPKGLRIKSFPTGPEAGDEVVADWTPEPHHEAFPGMVNGGIIGALLDCHGNWTAAWHLLQRAKAAGQPGQPGNSGESPPCTVTAEFHVKLHKPTPSNAPLHLSAVVTESSDRKAVVEVTLSSGGVVTSTCRGVFVAVREGHPAFHRW